MTYITQIDKHLIGRIHVPKKESIDFNAVSTFIQVLQGEEIHFELDDKRADHNEEKDAYIEKLRHAVRSPVSIYQEEGELYLASITHPSVPIGGEIELLLAYELAKGDVSIPVKIQEHRPLRLPQTRLEDLAHEVVR